MDLSANTLVLNHLPNVVDISCGPHLNPWKALSLCSCLQNLGNPWPLGPRTTVIHDSRGSSQPLRNNVNWRRTRLAGQLPPQVATQVARVAIAEQGTSSPGPGCYQERAFVRHHHNDGNTTTRHSLTKFFFYSHLQELFQTFPEIFSSGHPGLVQVGRIRCSPAVPPSLK